jgi:hypothetical protein
VFEIAGAADFAVEGEISVIAPYEAWHLLPQPSMPFRLSPGERSRVVVDVSAPPGSGPGNWWALLKIDWLGHVTYSPSVALKVQGRESSTDE